MSVFLDLLYQTPATNPPLGDSTMHRADFSTVEFSLFNMFCWALMLMKVNKYDSDSPRYLRHLCETKLCLPVWRLTDDNVWVLKKYRTYNKQAICIDIPAMRNICRAIHLTEAELVRLLYKLSMLSVDPTKPDCMGIHGMYVTEFPEHMFAAWMKEKHVGYVIEARRALGAYRTLRR